MQSSPGRRLPPLSFVGPRLPHSLVQYQLPELLFPTALLAPTLKGRYVSHTLSEAVSSLGAGLMCVQLCVPSSTSAPSFESCTQQVPSVGLGSRFAHVKRKLEPSKMMQVPATDLAAPWS